MEVCIGKKTLMLFPLFKLRHKHRNCSTLITPDRGSLACGFVGLLLPDCSGPVRPLARPKLPERPESAAVRICTLTRRSRIGRLQIGVTEGGANRQADVETGPARKG